MLIAQLSFAGLIFGIGLFIRDIQNAFNLAKNVEGYNRAACMLYGATTILAVALLQITLIMITLDRLTVLVFPLFYHRHAECVHLSIARFLITLLASLASFGGQFTGLALSTDVSLCSSGATWTDGYRVYFMVFTCTSSLLTIVLNLAAVIVYCRKTKIRCQRKENSIVLLETSILLSYFVFWCVPSIVDLIGIIFKIQAITFDSITLALLIGSAFFVSLNPFLFLWRNIEFRTFFFRFYRLRRISRKTPIFVQVHPSTTAKSTVVF
uniref:G-protein coupled receptors family 1 profile domain-containing protein n=1 Tax=Parascaris univalens TaxID=6257 RepID=A0A915BHG2_PARUN